MREPIPLPALNLDLPRPRPSRVVLTGSYVRLEPLDVARHAADLFAASSRPGADQRFRYLAEAPPNEVSFGAWIERAATSEDPFFHAVVDLGSGRCQGRQALMRITPEHGVIELGNILWNPPLARSRGATEAFYLAAGYVFDKLGYRRLEWKCDSDNLPSRKAAARFGFVYEGEFGQHMVIKGRNRDTAWFAMLDLGWLAVKARLEAWLDEANFDAQGGQRRRLEQFG